MDFYTDLIKKRDAISASLTAIESRAKDGLIQESDRKDYDSLSDSLDTVVNDLDRAAKRRDSELKGSKHSDGKMETQATETTEADHRRIPTIPGLNVGPGTVPVPTDNGVNDAPINERALAEQNRAILNIYPPANSWNEKHAIAHSFGQFLQDVRSEGLHGVAPDRLRKVHSDVLGGGSEREGTEGGWYIPPVFGGTLDRDIMIGSPFISRATQVPMSSNIIRFLVNDSPSMKDGARFGGGIEVGWITEGQSIPETGKPHRKALEMRLKKIGALGYLTEEIVEDAPAFGAIFQEAIGKEMRFQVENACAFGNGIAEPYGFWSSATNPALLTIAKVASQANDTVVWENMNDMITQLHPMSWESATWFFNYLVRPQLNRLATHSYESTGGSDANGELLGSGGGGGTRFVEWHNSGAHKGIVAFGLPGEATIFNEPLGDAGDFILCDWSQYFFGSKSMRTGVSMHVEFKTDQQAIKIVWRVEGRSSWLHALEPYKGSKKLSPCLVLAAR